MPSISNLEIYIGPFELRIVVDARATELRLRGTQVVLPEFSIEDGKPYDGVVFTDVLEAVCRHLMPVGMRLSFAVEPHEDRNHIKRIELTKDCGRLLGHGQQTQGYTSGTENLWQWSAIHTDGKKLEYPTGIDLDSLNEVTVTELRRVAFEFSALPAR